MFKIIRDSIYIIFLFTIIIFLKYFSLLLALIFYFPKFVINNIFSNKD